jgi:cytochrome c oxidase subunit 2
MSTRLDYFKRCSANLEPSRDLWWVAKWPDTDIQKGPTLIELIWTITPALVLIAIAFPSFKLLYMLDEVISPTMTIKVAGHQWYWSYEYSDFINEDGEAIEYDSYMVPDSDLEDGQLRLLDVDNRVIVPVDTHIRFIVTATDVIHDFAVPSLGLKIDAVPGFT